MIWNNVWIQSSSLTTVNKTTIITNRKVLLSFLLLCLCISNFVIDEVVANSSNNNNNNNNHNIHHTTNIIDVDKEFQSSSSSLSSTNAIAQHRGGSASTKKQRNRRHGNNNNGRNTNNNHPLSRLSSWNLQQVPKHNRNIGTVGSSSSSSSSRMPPKSNFNSNYYKYGDLLLPSRRPLPDSSSSSTSSSSTSVFSATLDQQTSKEVDSAAIATNKSTTTQQHQVSVNKKSQSSSSSTKSNGITKFDLCMFAFYFSTAIALTLPVILIPLIGLESASLSSLSSSLPQSSLVTSFVATVASISIVGGASGKIVNGIVCQRLGATLTAKIYLIGMALFSFGLATLGLSSPTTPLAAINVGRMAAGIEFFSGVMWTAASILVTTHYAKSSPADFARGVTILSLSSTGGQLAAKLFGSLLSKFISWRSLSLCGSMLSLLSLILVSFVLPKFQKNIDSDRNNTKKQIQKFLTNNKKTTNNNNVLKQTYQVFKSPLFWMITFGHVSGFLARSVDRIMVPFLKEVTGLPPKLCASMTGAIQIGFVHGLSTRSKGFDKINNNNNNKKTGNNNNIIQHKNEFLKRGYRNATLSILGLALCSTKVFQNVITNSYLKGLIIVLCCINWSSNIAVSFFQIPNITSSSKNFVQNKAICLSFVEGFAFLLTAPIWGISNKIVTKFNSWSPLWILISIIFTFCSTIMMKSIQTIWIEQYGDSNSSSSSNTISSS